jgi:hypothetical protein
MIDNCAGCAFGPWNPKQLVCSACPHNQAQPSQTEEPDLDVLEATLQDRVVHEIAEPNGWTTWHDRSKKKNKRGFLDLFCVRERVVFLELKRKDKRVRPEQQTMIDALTKAGAEVYVFGPQDWRQIEEVLR